MGPHVSHIGAVRRRHDMDHTPTMRSDLTTRAGSADRSGPSELSAPTDLTERSGHATVDLIVVGGGLAGLCAAATAARDGLRVVVFESRGLGGRAAVTTVDPGVVFNAGPRAYYPGGPGAAALAALGITPRGGTPDASRSYGVRDGQLHRLPAGPLTLARTKLLSTRSKLAVGKLLATIGRLDTTTLASVSVRQWMQGAGLAPDAVDLLRTVIRTATYAADIDEFSAGAALAQVQLVFGPGVRYLDGGFAQLVDAQRAAAVAAGAEVVDHEAVRSIFSTAGEAGGAWTVATASRSIRAHSVLVATGSPDAVDRLLPVELDRRGIGEPVTAACLELATRRPPNQPLLLGVGDPVYLSRHTPAAAGLAPEGITVVHVVRYGARTSDQDRRDLWALTALAGIAPSDVVAERFLHRMVVSGGLPLASTGGLPGRPPVQVAGADGLFVAGDWVGDQGLLADAALASGRRAAVLAAQRLAGLATSGGDAQRVADAAR